jgi:peroxiredoxin
LHVSRNKWSRTSCGLLATLLLTCGLGAAARPAQAAETLLNHKAPVFTRHDLKGQTINIARLRGKVVLLNFWATWCAPCQAEMPKFSAWQKEYGPRGFQVIGISMDDSKAPVQKLVARLKLDYPIAMGDVKLGNLYGKVLGLPLTFLIDRHGVVRGEFQGGSDLKMMESMVRELLEKK